EKEKVLIPTTVEDLMDRATEYAVDKAKERTKGKLLPIEKTHEQILEELLHNVPSGRDAALQAERDRLRGYLTELRKPGTMDQLTKLAQTKEFNKTAADLAKSAVSELAKQAIKTGVKKATQANEEAAWTDYFKHDIRSRTLFVVYQRFREIYYDESDRYA